MNISVFNLIPRYRHRNAFIQDIAALSMLLCAQGAVAQTPSDALMMPSRNVCILMSYDLGQFDRYWESDDLRRNETIATVHRNTLLPMAAIGIFDKINLYVGLPYVKTESTEPNGGKFEGAKGFQDIGVALKYRALHRNVGKGQLSLLSTIGYTTPATNYLSDYMPYSLGSGAPEFSLRGIVQYRLPIGVYARGGLAHLWRGTTEAERDYYYNNGSYYSSTMDVPDAWNYEGILGTWLLDSRMKIELSYSALKSTSGDNIRAYNAAQATNKVQYERIGVSLQYFFPGIKGLGVAGYFNQVVNGLNTAKLTNTGMGLTYQFNYLKTKDNNGQDAQ